MMSLIKAVRQNQNIVVVVSKQNQFCLVLLSRQVEVIMTGSGSYGRETCLKLGDSRPNLSQF